MMSTTVMMKITIAAVMIATRSKNKTILIYNL